jgi:hypothetical protein
MADAFERALEALSHRERTTAELGLDRAPAPPRAVPDIEDAEAPEDEAAAVEEAAPGAEAERKAA